MGFAGITKGAYSFTLSDTSAPTVIKLKPKDGATSVDPNSVVQFTFNEPIVLGPSDLLLTLTRLDTARSGAASSEVSSKIYSFDVPHVRAQGDYILEFDMKGKTSPGWLYSIALPPGAVADLSGNKFVGLSGGKYTFRVAETSLRAGSRDSGNSMTGFIVALTVGLVCGGMCVATLVWKFQSACYSQQQLYRRQEKRPLGQVSVPVT